VQAGRSRGLRTVIDQQRRILAYETLGEYFSAEANRAVLEAELGAEKRREHEKYADMAERAERLDPRIQ